MAEYVQTNVRLFAGGADLTSRSNKVEFGVAVEAKPTTNYGSGGWVEVLGALGDSALMGEGQWEAGDLGKIDDQAWAAMGAVGGFTICPDGASTGSVAWLVKALQASYKLGGQVGEVAPWSTSASGSWPVSRGVVLNPPGTARTSTGSGTATQIAAVPTGSFLYATLHVLSVSGTSSPTITVKIQSSVDNTFGSPTDQITFTAATAIGGQMSRVAGPITDTWFRATWTISGTNPSFLAVIAAGIK
jgi:hypothetical protein